MLRDLATFLSPPPVLLGSLIVSVCFSQLWSCTVQVVFHIANVAQTNERVCCAGEQAAVGSGAGTDGTGAGAPTMTLTAAGRQQNPAYRSSAATAGTVSDSTDDEMVEMPFEPGTIEMSNV